MSGGRSTITIENSDIPTTRQASGSGEIHLRAPPHPVMWSCCVELRPGYSGVIEGQGVIDGVISGRALSSGHAPVLLALPRCHKSVVSGENLDLSIRR